MSDIFSNVCELLRHFYSVLGLVNNHTDNNLISRINKLLNRLISIKHSIEKKIKEIESSNTGKKYFLFF